MKKNINLKLLILVIITLSFFIVLYWFIIKPYQIRKNCAFIEIKSYTQKEKEEAKKYLIKNCPIVSNNIAERVIFNYKNEITQECKDKKYIVMYAPIGDKNQKRPAKDNEYFKCLRENGLEYYQETKTEFTQPIENTPGNKPTKEFKSIIPSSEKKSVESVINNIKQDQAQKCQENLNKYNICLSEYNSKMAEYNSCINGNGYTSFCSKPSNLCFKPSCAY